MPAALIQWVIVPNSPKQCHRDQGMRPTKARAPVIASQAVP